MNTKDFAPVTSDGPRENNKVDTLMESTMAKNPHVPARVIGTDYTYRHKIVWKNAIGFLILHMLAVWGFFIFIRGGVCLKSLLWNLVILFVCAEGVTIGAHRLYTHKSFSATPLLRAFLLLFQTMAGQNSMYIWCRDHRLHHRYSDTDADPHNSKRGFFFSHIGWLMSRKHPYVIEMGKRIDMSDLEADWMVMFQKKYYYPLYMIFALFIPVWVPIQYFGETFWNSLLVCYFFRYCYQLNATWLVNSAAHLYGTRPYDKNLQPVESWFVSLICFGEGWHNYHHVFPWDYKTAELPTHLNISAVVIRMLEKIRLAYDLKAVPPEMAARNSILDLRGDNASIVFFVLSHCRCSCTVVTTTIMWTVAKRIIKTGDGTHHVFGNEEAKAAVTAIGPLHPLNPSYTTKHKPL